MSLEHDARLLKKPIFMIFLLDSYIFRLFNIFMYRNNYGLVKNFKTKII